MKRRSENIQVIVCGSNRSGTSLMMQCLEKAGFKMAEDLILGNKGNIYGFYESKRFKEICRKPNVERFRKLLDKKGKWAWKYPSAVHVLDTIFEAAKNMFVIYMVRPKDDVIRSMIRHCKVNDVAPLTEKSYAKRYDRSLKAIKAYKHKKIKVNFLDLVKNEKMIVNKVLDFLGLETNYNNTVVDIKEVHFIQLSYE